MEKNIEQFDVRVVEHHIRRGLLTRDDYEAYLKTLTDEGTEGVETATRFVNPFWERHYGPGAQG